MINALVGSMLLTMGSMFYKCPDIETPNFAAWHKYTAQSGLFEFLYPDDYTVIETDGIVKVIYKKEKTRYVSICLIRDRILFSPQRIGCNDKEYCWTKYDAPLGRQSDGVKLHTSLHDQIYDVDGVKGNVKSHMQISSVSSVPEWQEQESYGNWTRRYKQWFSNDLAIRNIANVELVAAHPNWKKKPFCDGATPIEELIAETVQVHNQRDNADSR